MKNTKIEVVIFTRERQNCQSSIRKEQEKIIDNISHKLKKYTTELLGNNLCKIKKLEIVQTFPFYHSLKHEDSWQAHCCPEVSRNKKKERKKL